MKLSIGSVAEPGSTRINKTGSWRTFKPIIDIEACTGCGACVATCPVKAIKVSEKKIREEFDYEHN